MGNNVDCRNTRAVVPSQSLCSVSLSKRLLLTADELLLWQLRDVVVVQLIFGESHEQLFVPLQDVLAEEKRWPKKAFGVGKSAGLFGEEGGGEKIVVSGSLRLVKSIPDKVCFSCCNLEGCVLDASEDTGGLSSSIFSNRAGEGLGSFLGLRVRLGGRLATDSSSEDMTSVLLSCSVSSKADFLALGFLPRLTRVFFSLIASLVTDSARSTDFLLGGIANVVTIVPTILMLNKKIIVLFLLNMLLALPFKNKLVNLN
jgi:hypothetical protein